MEQWTKNIQIAQEQQVEIAQLKVEINKKGGNEDLDKIKNLFKEYVPVKEWA